MKGALSLLKRKEETNIKLATTSHQTFERSTLPRAAASARAAMTRLNPRKHARDTSLASEHNRRGREGRKDEGTEARTMPLFLEGGGGGNLARAERGKRERDSRPASRSPFLS